jgi:AraC-like DNA-binding protein
MAETFSLYEEIEYPFPAGFKCFTASIESSCPHWHDAYEIVIPVTGQVTVRYKGAAYTLVRRSILLINSREIHSFTCGSQPNVCLFLQFSPNAFRLAPNQDSRIFNFYLNTADPSLKLRVPSERFIEPVARLWMHAYEKRKGYQFRMHAEFFRLLAELLANTIYDERFFSDAQAAESDTYILDQLSSFVHEHYAEEICVEDICRRLGMSRSTLYRFGKSVLGCSISDYINQVRITEAKRLLRRTEQPISAIAQACGYSSDTSFYRAFKSQVGKTPNEFRKEGAVTPSDGRIQGYISHDTGAVYRLLKESPLLAKFSH